MQYLLFKRPDKPVQLLTYTVWEMIAKILLTMIIDCYEVVAIKMLKDF